MRKSIIGWLIWFLVVATVLVFLNVAEHAKKQSDRSTPRRFHQDYQSYMD